jgi:hypothetical protein
VKGIQLLVFVQGFPEGSILFHSAVPRIGDHLCFDRSAVTLGVDTSGVEVSYRVFRVVHHPTYQGQESWIEVFVVEDT